MAKRSRQRAFKLTRDRVRLPHEGDRLLSAKQLGEFLGVSIGTIYYWVSTEQIPFAKIGKHLRFWQSDIVSWLKSETKKAKRKRRQQRTPKQTPAGGEGGE